MAESTGYCGPYVLYVIFMLALITYDLTQYDKKAAIRDTIFLIIGGFLLWLLCKIGFEIAGWILISVIPFFFVSLIALLIVTQIVRTEVNYDDNYNKIFTGKKLLDYFGYDDFDRKKVVRPPGAGAFDIIAKPDPDPCSPEIAKITPVKRIIMQLERKSCPKPSSISSCNNKCNNQCNNQCK